MNHTLMLEKLNLLQVVGLEIFIKRGCFEPLFMFFNKLADASHSIASNFNINANDWNAIIP